MIVNLLNPSKPQQTKCFKYWLKGKTTMSISWLIYFRDCLTRLKETKMCIKTWLLGLKGRLLGCLIKILTHRWLCLVRLVDSRLCNLTICRTKTSVLSCLRVLKLLWKIKLRRWLQKCWILPSTRSNRRLTLRSMTFWKPLRFLSSLLSSKLLNQWTVTSGCQRKFSSRPNSSPRDSQRRALYT